MQIFKEFKRDKWASVWLYAGSFVFLVFQALGFLLSRTQADAAGSSVRTLALALFAALLLALPLSLLLLKAVSWRRLRAFLAPSSGEKELSWLLIFILLFLLWLPCYLAFYPGIAAYDMGYQWRIYLEQNLNTHHPLIHTLLMSWTFELVHRLSGSFNLALAVHSLSQLLVQAAVLSYGLWSMQKLRLPRWIFILSALFYGLFPLFPVLGISTTKDVLFAAFMLLALICAINAAETGGRKKHVISFALSLMLAMLFRNNALYAALAVSVFMLLFLLKCRRKKFVLRIIAGIIAAVVAAEISFFALQKATSAEDGSPVEMMSVPLQQIARVYSYHYNQLERSDMDRIAVYFDIDKIGAYRQEISDPVKGSFFHKDFQNDPAGFVKLWLDLGLRFPFTYIDAFLYNTISLWYLQDDSILNAKKSYLEMGFYPFDASAHPDSKLPQLEKLYRGLMEEGSITGIPLLSLLASPALYFWLLFAAFVLLLAKRKYELMFIPLLPFMYLATLLLGPCILPRYCFVAVGAAPLILAWLVHLANAKS